MASATSSISPSSSSLKTDAENEPLYHVKLLSALRSGDPALIHPFLAEIGKDRRKSAQGNLDTGAAALHLAIRCASADTVALLLAHRAISPNGVHPPESGSTALHLAASLGRVEIVNLLIDQPGIDDTLRDVNGRTCKDVARGKEVTRAIEDSRSFLNASYRSLLRSYIHSPHPAGPSSELLSLLESPRIQFVNLSYLDDDSGTSLLHEAARRKDLRLIELAVRSGADVFVRDRRGKMAYEGTGKDDKVRVFLRQFANQDNTLLQQTPISDPPALKGYLNKYTNVAKGYNTRWFVLNSGVLSYYRHQEDETVASRGSISMKTALLKTSSSDRTRFEVHSTPSRGHQSIQKWFMKANHPVEASRWIQAIGKSIEWYKMEKDSATDGGRKSGESDSASSVAPKIKPSGSISSSHRTSFSSTSLLKRGGKHRQSTINVGSEAESGMDNGLEESPTTNFEQNDDADDEAGNDESSIEESTSLPPHQNNFELSGNSMAAQIELTTQLLGNLPAGEIKAALGESLAVAQGMLTEYMQMAREREEWWSKELQKERGRQTIWQESLATVVKEGETLEMELRARSRKRGSKFFDSAEGTLRQRSMFLPPKSPPLVELHEPISAMLEPVTPTPMNQPSVRRSETEETLTRATFSTPTPLELDGDTDEEDEFFDAIEANNLPNLVVAESMKSPVHSEIGFSLDPDFTLPYSGYRNLREKLDLTDERPNTSLWSVLKNSIGKDLTKISFPVSFNEPTSMLQRMAEDMEFTECLDTAAQEPDAHRRLAFVAAFAMSNYSSTIGRIAKPFNPMLSETFEYVRFDKEFRYVSEQVSHHPPISACWAESPSWNYFGEVDAQNKFMGKSFEIRPTGIAHAELLIPEALGPNYPKATGKKREGKVVEHYSWKKVTTNVSGFILGSPTIDHYGDMKVKIVNHRTGDQCILTFKPRGWRGKDAFEISGKVMDAGGRVTMEIAGRWNSQLIARQVGGGSGVLHPDITVSDPKSPSATPEYILLWRNSPKVDGAPFNLTPFAMTLNHCPKDLKPYLCPTDCRLRPDQRAFEMGKYDIANDLKNLQETKQRAIRKEREEGKIPPHQPRWFRAETDGDTGDRVWAPSRVDNGTLEYWAQREQVWKMKQKGQGEWKDVDLIFIEEPDFIKAAS
ncbi:Oxysterol-binding protein-domain-containing protein [Mycena floridula]|nr:Oxysterol-binding protein-domain-containing protein [Mycena floridula]